MTGCPDHRHDLGAAVLHGLSPDEARALEEHLATCTGCRSEHAELAAAAALLELARDAPPAVPARVRDRVVAEAARRRHRTRWLAAAAAVATVAALAGGVVGWLVAPADPAAVAVPLEGVGPFPATGSATFRAADGALVVDLVLERLPALPSPAVYEAWVSTSDGRVVSIGQLDAPEEGAVSATLAAEGPPEAYRGLWVTAEPDARDPAHDGPTVVEGPVPALP